MKVKCISNLGSDLPKDCLDPRVGYDESKKFFLEIGKEYTVYAMTLYLGYIWYYLCDEAYTYYPRWNPSPLFQVVDGRLSKYWIYSYFPENKQVIIAYEEWAKDPYYYDSLTDKDEDAVKIFQHYKKLMDQEFKKSDNSSYGLAVNLDKDNWVMCPSCDEAWQVQVFEKIVVCPGCGKTFTNPLKK